MLTRYLLKTRLLLVLLSFPFSLIAEPIFDVHLHYSAADAQVLTPRDIITKLDRSGVRYAVVTGTPASHVNTLYNHAPDRIVPMLGVYRSIDDKISWVNDASLPSYVEAELKTGKWRGIGELHIFARDRHSKVFRRIVELAASRKIILQIHGDPAVIDTVYDIAPAQPVIWAHAGTFPYPDLIADYLQRYPALSIDLSMRDERIAPEGRINDAWYELFVTYPDRFMVGVDTYSMSRWQNFETAVLVINIWLAQLPGNIAAQFSFGNAASLFEKPK